MIRTVALGFICLAGLGAIAAAAMKSTPPPPEVVMPVVSGNKADRLPLAINEDKPTDAEKVDVVYVQPSEEGQAIASTSIRRTGSYTTSRHYFSSLARSTSY